MLSPGHTKHNCCSSGSNFQRSPASTCSNRSSTCKLTLDIVDIVIVVYIVVVFVLVIPFTRRWPGNTHHYDREDIRAEGSYAKDYQQPEQRE